MQEKKDSINESVQKTANENKPDVDGYPLYPVSEDIYNKYKEEESINPEDLSTVKQPNEKKEHDNEKDFVEDVSGSDLDVPGAELDDEKEKTGGEDEENNYYSLGGDNHNDLDEDKN
ncbi:MAG TPA: hypothetical protein PLP23_17975 [Panacibacter sp.]|nr:hypothetical protein [Panacibacter sp.]